MIEKVKKEFPFIDCISSGLVDQIQNLKDLEYSCKLFDLQLIAPLFGLEHNDL